MVNNGYIVDGFMVTRKEDAHQVLFGREIFQINEVNPAPDRVAIVAATGSACKEMQKTLSNLGWKYSVYVTG